MTQVLDASALMVYLEKEPGYEKVKEALARSAESDKTLLMNIVNWGEVYYILIRDHGLEKAEEIMQIVETFPVECVLPDQTITKQAALYKALKKLPYADSHAAALAKNCKGELLTSDKEFKLVERDIKILWI